MQLLLNELMDEKGRSDKCDAIRDCRLPAVSATCPTCDKKHSLGRIHYHAKLVPACVAHIRQAGRYA